MSLPASYLPLARLSLALVWILTAWASVFGDYQFGLGILSAAGIHGLSADALIFAGAGTDLFIGLWMLTGKARTWCYRAQIVVIITYTALLSLMAPQFWLHPFGPLSKNLPIIALTLLLLGLERE